MTRSEAQTRNMNIMRFRGVSNPLYLVPDDIREMLNEEDYGLFLETNIKMNKLSEIIIDKMNQKVQENCKKHKFYDDWNFCIKCGKAR